MSARPRYRLLRANEHCLIFSRTDTDPGVEPTYLVSRVTWARWCRGDWP